MRYFSLLAVFRFSSRPQHFFLACTATASIFAVCNSCKAEEFLTCRSEHSNLQPQVELLESSTHSTNKALEEEVKTILHGFAGDDITAYFGLTPAILVTGEIAPNAYVTKVNEIVLSKGLLSVVNSKAELAFVVAHELGHIVLGHNRHDAHHYAFIGGTAHIREGIEREIQADTFALNLLISNGFEGGSAINLLSRLGTFGSDHGAALNQSYPSLEVRLSALKRQLTAPLCDKIP